MLSIGGPAVTNTFTTAGQSNVFVLAAPPGAFAVSAQATASHSALRLFVGKGYVPGPSHFDFESSQFNSPTASMTVSGNGGSTYYIVVYAASLDAPFVSYTLTVAALNFAVSSANPTSIANSGPVTLQVFGGQLAANDIYTLSGPGGTFAASSVQSPDPTVAYATFNLGGAQTGMYNLKVTQPGGAALTLSNAVTANSPIKAAVAPTLSVQLELPPAYRKGRAFDGTLVYHNAGDVDMPSPVLVLSSGGMAETEVQGMTNFTTSDILLVAASFDGPAGILTPGRTWTIDFTSFYPACATIPFSVTYVTADATNLINYTLLEPLLRPPGYCDSAWRNPGWHRSNYLWHILHFRDCSRRQHYSVLIRWLW